MTNGAEQETPAQPVEQQLLANVLDFHLQASSSPSKTDRKWQRGLGLLCIAGALFVAIWLVIAGPPTPKTSEAESADAAKVTGVDTALTAATTPGDAAPGGDSTPGGTPGQSSDDSEPDQPTPPDQDSEGSGESEGEADTTSSLNGEAPWVFAIVALLVGAFLAAGQSLGFGGDKAANPDAQEDPPDPDDPDPADPGPPTPDPAPAKP